MTHQISVEDARAGDVVNVVGHRVAATARSGQILEVLGQSEHPSFRVQWEDGHVSHLYPSSDAAFTRASA
jgi:hypothetical protein